MSTDEELLAELPGILEGEGEAPGGDFGNQCPTLDIFDLVFGSIVKHRGTGNDDAIAFDDRSYWKGQTGFVTGVDDDELFDADQTAVPFSAIQDIPDNGRLWAIYLASDEEVPESRTNVSRLTVPIQLCFHKRLRSKDFAEIRRLTILIEQFKEVCRRCVASEAVPFNWVSNEALKDENGTIFNYVGLRTENVFEAIFTANYHATLA